MPSGSTHPIRRSRGCMVTVPLPFYFLLRFNSIPVSPLHSTLEAELEKLLHRAGLIVEYVGAHGSTLAEHLDNVPCCVRDIIDFGIHRGAAIVLIIGEVRSGCTLRCVVGPPSHLSDEGLRWWTS
jgi:hypothetical protein